MNIMLEKLIKIREKQSKEPKSIVKKAGFTLIELSIVLVIIGLIVGGVLVGQDLIKAAEIRATIAQYEKYNSAMNTFRTKYNGMPGDLLSTQALAFGLTCLGGSATTCTGGTGLGDGNGLLEGAAAGTAAQIGEPPLMWRQLVDASLIDGSVGSTIVQTSGAMTTAGPASFFPAAKLGRGNYWIAGANTGFNYYMLGSVSTTSATDAAYAATPQGSTPIEAYNIDSKLDDGMPNTGIVQARGTAIAPNTLMGAIVAGNAAAGGGSATEASTSCQISATTTATATGNTYARGSTAGNSPNCLLRLRFN